jgi:hypothetical protein
VLGKIPTDSPVLPVILRCDRAGFPAQVTRQRRPDHRGIEVASVIGEVDALRHDAALVGRLDPYPPRLGAGDQLNHRRDHLGRQM